MENAARNVIVAVQNSLLGSLVFQLVIGLAPVMILLGTLSPHSSASGYALGLMVFGVALIFSAWLTGHVANRRARVPSGDTAASWPRNGFEAWREVSEDGLRPSPFMRRLVTRLGSGKVSAALFCIPLLIVLAGCWAAIFPEWFQSRFPVLAVEDVRRSALQIWTFAAIAMSIRHWALYCFKRLAPVAA